MTSRRARPHRVALLIVEVAVRMLPAGDVRRRYERELIAELVCMPRHRQLGYAVGTLATSRALRHAVAGRQQRDGIALVRTHHFRLRCVLAGHAWRKQFTEDNQRYAACRRCDKVVTDAVWIIDPAVQGGLGVR